MSALANQKPQTDGNGRGLKGPLISLDTLDGPTQRFWASCAFIALLVSNKSRRNRHIEIET